MQSMAAIQLKTSPLYSWLSVHASAKPIMTGTAAPLSVCGRAASSHACNEFCLISLSSIPFAKIIIFVHECIQINMD